MVIPKADSETRIQEQVDCLEGDPRKMDPTSGEVR